MPQIMDTPGVPDKFKPKVRALTDDIGRGRRPNVDVEKVRQMYLQRRDVDVNDNMLDLLPKAGKTRKVAQATSRSGMRMPWDTDTENYMYHRTPARNVEGIRARGNDPSLRKRGSFGTHFSADPEHTWTYADEANAGSEPSAMLRVRRDAAPFRQLDPYDYVTEERIPRGWEVLEEGPTPSSPGTWGRLNSFGSGAKTLYDLLSSFIPALPTIQTPADWVIQDLMRTNSSSPWNPKNQMGYTTPA